MKNKQIQYLLPARSIDMGGFPVKQPLPTQRIQQVDPFLLLHHASAKFSDKRPAKHQGVGPHPHRGFSPVTFVIDGAVHHQDSRGNNQVAKKGEVQWMHAGMGIVHSERPSQELVDSNGRQEIIQLWVNSPAAKKMLQPSYQFLTNDNTPVFKSADGKVVNKLIVGQYDGLSSPLTPQSPLLIVWSKAAANGKATLQIPENFSAMLYNIKGNISIAGHGLVEKEHLAVFEKEGNQITLTAQTDAEFILFAGLPLEEPVTQNGPFVMNTQTEILEAFRDYRMGKMGVLIEE